MLQFLIAVLINTEPVSTVLATLMLLGMMDDMTDMESLESTEIFDKEFIEQMIPRHQMAVMMAFRMLNRIDHTGMKKLAQDNIRTQTEK
jgi:uncharacterized protein (DUF305 family)